MTQEEVEMEGEEEEEEPPPLHIVTYEELVEVLQDFPTDYTMKKVFESLISVGEKPLTLTEAGAFVKMADPKKTGMFNSANVLAAAKPKKGKSKKKKGNKDEKKAKTKKKK